MTGPTVECVALKPGTLTGYKKQRCRCTDCRAANSAWTRRRKRQMAYGRWQPLIDAEPVRLHVKALSAAGLGARRVCALAGVSESAVRGLLHGRPGRSCARIRPDIAAAILAVRVTPDVIAAGQHVDAAPTRRRIQALMAIGWSLAAQARKLGRSPANYTKILHGALVEVGTARQVAGLYRQFEASPPPESWVKARTIRYAVEHGFALPAAWDDIDAPDAVPHDPTEPDPLPDEVLVALAIREQWPLVRIERRIDRAAIVTALAGTGIAPSTVAARLKTSTPVVTKLLAEVAA